MLLNLEHWQLIGAILSVVGSAVSLWNVTRKLPEIRAFVADRLELLAEIKSGKVTLEYATTRALAAESVASGLGASIESLTLAMHEMKADMDSLRLIEGRFDSLAEYVRSLLSYLATIESMAKSSGIVLAIRPLMPKDVSDLFGGTRQ